MTEYKLGRTCECGRRITDNNKSGLCGSCYRKSDEWAKRKEKHVRFVGSAMSHPLQMNGIVVQVVLGSEIIKSIDPACYDISKPFARGLLMDEIAKGIRAAQKKKGERRNSGKGSTEGQDSHPQE